MDHTHLPIQVISLCGADGQIKPLRFRFEDEAHGLHTVNILEVLDVRNVMYVGIEAFRFLCRGAEDGESHVFELNYAVRSHRWSLLKKVY
ncbi:MAG: hypothetical protein J6K84_02145 [Oscillospiraceae bacterium]|nr:hypothetical protein [Oscillospiraceae bacterium]